MFPNPPKILLVEDNPGDARLFREMLSEDCPGIFHVEWVTRLAEGLKRLERGGIDVVLLDLGLPDSQELDTFTRAYDHSPHVPFVVLTGLADETVGIAAVRQGAQDYLVKGEVEVKPLLRAIRYATERKRAGEALQRAYDELTQANRELQLEMAERRRVEKAVDTERQRLFAVLDNLPAFVCLKAPDYTIRFTNRVFREIFDMPGVKHCYEVLGRNEPCEPCLSFEVLKTNSTREWEWSAADGGRTYQIYDYPFADIDGTPLILTLGVDITARKHAEDKLRDSQKNLRQLASQLLTAQEKERKRISRDLHDVLGGSLVSVKLQTKKVERRLAQEAGEIKNECSLILSCLDELIDTVRHISRDLSPAILEDLGITSALRHLFGEFAKRFEESRCSIAIDEINDLFCLEDQINLYRIFQEALTNISKYGQATQISGIVKRGKKEVYFAIEDNGRGFDMRQALAADYTGRGMGLATMEERVLMLGGEMQIWSKVGSGTRISFALPIAKDKKNPAAAAGLDDSLLAGRDS